MNSPEKNKNSHPEKSPEKSGDESNWSHDIEKRDYYYDDSTGYEVYQPDENENDDEDARPEEKAVVS